MSHWWVKSLQFIILQYYIDSQLCSMRVVLYWGDSKWIIVSLNRLVHWKVEFKNLIHEVEVWFQKSWYHTFTWMFSWVLFWYWQIFFLKRQQKDVHGQKSTEWKPTLMPQYLLSTILSIIFNCGLFCFFQHVLQQFPLIWVITMCLY